MKTTRAERHSWTKDDIKSVIGLWESKTVNNIADELGVKREQVSYIANAIRKAGYKLPRKRVLGRLSALIKETIAEIR